GRAAPAGPPARPPGGAAPAPPSRGGPRRATEGEQGSDGVAGEAGHGATMAGDEVDHASEEAVEEPAQLLGTVRAAVGQGCAQPGESHDVAEQHDTLGILDEWRSASLGGEQPHRIVGHERAIGHRTPRLNGTFPANLGIPQAARTGYRNRWSWRTSPMGTERAGQHELAERQRHWHPDRWGGSGREPPGGGR